MIDIRFYSCPQNLELRAIPKYLNSKNNYLIALNISLIITTAERDPTLLL
ncbi:MAG: hypothetical protein ACJA1C_001110 [Crocinitomicaceae bacterium]|jgi:hypothetical protein